MTGLQTPTTAPSIVQDEPAFPPGWVGVMAQFIYNHAPYSNKNVAIAGALALLSALCGRTTNVSGSGLNIMLAIVGGTGIGKEAASSGISKLVSYASKTTPNIQDFIGPSSLASPEAAHKRLAKTPSGSPSLHPKLRPAPVFLKWVPEPIIWKRT